GNPGEPRLCAKRVLRRESFLNSHSASDRPQERLQAATAICSALELISVLLQGDANQLTASTHASLLEKLLQACLKQAPIYADLGGDLLVSEAFQDIRQNLTLPLDQP